MSLNYFKNCFLYIHRKEILQIILCLKQQKPQTLHRNLSDVPRLCIYTISEPPSIINVHALNVLHASYPCFRFSPLVDTAEDDDGQGKDEHEDAHADGNHLVQVHLRASVVADEEAAVAAVRRRAAAEEQRSLSVHSRGEHEPTCTCRYDAAIL